MGMIFAHTAYSPILTLQTFKQPEPFMLIDACAQVTPAYTACPSVAPEPCVTPDSE